MVAVMTDYRPIDLGPAHDRSGEVWPALSLVPPPSARMSRSGRRPSAAVYRRRRIVAAGLGLLGLALGIMAVQSALVRAGGGPLTTTGAGGLTDATARVWVVQRGDTLWSIASAVDKHSDVRPLVDHMAAETGGTSLYPGERITIP